MNLPLTLVEEIELLSLDDKTGAHLPLLPEALGYGLAGAILADLEMAACIATGGKVVEVKNSMPTGNSLLDPWLARVVAEPQNHPIAYWLSLFSDEKTAIESAALEHLISRGILKREDKKILWVFGLRRYPTIHNEERVEVRTRLAGLIQGDEAPPRFDAILISLLWGSSLLSAVFSEGELDGRSARIASISDSDPVGREVAEASRQMIEALMLAQSVTSTPF
jgi:Golgi phosphoprotein 3